MITTNTNGSETLKQVRERESKEKEALLRKACEEYAVQKYGEEKINQWSNANKGLWYLPALDDNESIEKLAIMKPIDRHILSRATDKIENGGLYMFLEACMRECWIEGDPEILDDEEYFIPSAMKFNKILEGKKVAFVKR